MGEDIVESFNTPFYDIWEVPVDFWVVKLCEADCLLWKNREAISVQFIHIFSVLSVKFIDTNLFVVACCRLQFLIKLFSWNKKKELGNLLLVVTIKCKSTKLCEKISVGKKCVCFIIHLKKRFTFANSRLSFLSCFQ